MYIEIIYKVVIVMAYVYEEIIVGGALSVEPGRGYIMDSSPGCLITGDGTQSVLSFPSEPTEKSYII